MRYIYLILMVICLSGCQRACSTSDRMAEQTIFNADKHVYTYEEFHREYESFQQYERQYETTKREIRRLDSLGKNSGQVYDNLTMKLTGTRDMMARIASNYNAMSNIAYQQIWKSKGLPETLNVPID